MDISFVLVCVRELLACVNAKRHLGTFQVLSVTKEAAVNTAQAGLGCLSSVWNRAAGASQVHQEFWLFHIPGSIWWPWALGHACECAAMLFHVHLERLIPFTGCHYVALAGLELGLWSRLVWDSETRPPPFLVL